MRSCTFTSKRYGVWDWSVKISIETETVNYYRLRDGIESNQSREPAVTFDATLGPHDSGSEIFYVQLQTKMYTRLLETTIHACINAFLPTRVFLPDLHGYRYEKSRAIKNSKRITLKPCGNTYV